MPRKPKANVKTSCYEADAVQEIAAGLIPEFHGTLKSASIEYFFLTREDEDTQKILPPRAQDALRFGRVQVADKVSQEAEHWHFRLVLNGNWWEKATPEQKLGAVDTLLAACWMREGRPLKVQPDVRGVFLGVYKRRGAWSKELADFAAALAQQELPLEPAPAAGS